MHGVNIWTRRGACNEGCVELAISKRNWIEAPAFMCVLRKQMNRNACYNNKQILLLHTKLWEEELKYMVVHKVNRAFNTLDRTWHSGSASFLATNRAKIRERCINTSKYLTATANLQTLNHAWGWRKEHAIKRAGKDQRRGTQQTERRDQS